MKRLIIIIMSGLLFQSCEQPEDSKSTDFIKNHKKPIVVRSGKNVYNNEKKDLTLLSKDGGVLLLEYTSLTFPDTIK